MKKHDEEAPHKVLPFAPYTAGQTEVIRAGIEVRFRLSIDKPDKDLRRAERAALEKLWEQAHVGLETPMAELPQNRADRRRMLRQINDPTVRAERRGRYGKRRKRARA